MHEGSVQPAGQDTRKRPNPAAGMGTCVRHLAEFSSSTFKSTVSFFRPLHEHPEGSRNLKSQRFGVCVVCCIGVLGTSQEARVPGLSRQSLVLFNPLGFS